MQVILVDTFGFFFRSYYALPPLHNSKNFPTSLLTGFATLIFNLYKDNKDSCIIFALEGDGINKRKEIYNDYKANRKETPQDLLKQLPVAIEWLKKMGLPTLSISEYEADDCIATLATLAKKDGFEVQIISHDKDLYQLIDNKIYLFDYAKRQKIGIKECESKFGVTPNEFVTYQSIVGDTSDNIPGIKGIGAKGAQKILSSFKTLESLYETLENDYGAIETLFGKRTAKLIAENKDNAFLSKELVTLKRDLLQDFSFIKHNFTQSPLINIVDELKEYELYKTLQKINFNATTQQNIDSKHFQQESAYKKQDVLNTTNNKFNFKAHLITDAKELFEILNKIPKDTLIAFDCETNGLDIKNANMVGFSFCFDGINAYYVPFLHGGIKRENLSGDNVIGQEVSLFDIKPSNNEQLKIPKQVSQKDAKKALELIFTYPLVGHNIKFDLHITQNNFGISPKSTTKDTMILAWLDDTSQILKLDNLMYKHFSHNMIKFNDIVPKNNTFDDIELDIASEYAAEDAAATYRLYKYYINTLEKKILQIADEIEFPFIQTICNMENNGIEINYKYFISLKKRFERDINSLQQKIYEVAGSTFNVNSPKQVAEILFDKLKLSKQRKGKSGDYSTDEATLNALKDEHEVIPLLIEYREIFKLFSTYVEPVLAIGKNHNRIYSSFIQTGTSTGRLSSKSPNLQNIPVRSELGRSIREGFQSKEGNMLVSLDYSQIELRLLAHFSEDMVLLDAFKKGSDIHLETAKMLFPNESDDKISSLRNIAKSINFGLIYGMGARKLSKTINISQNEAKQYIENYFVKFPSVKNFLQDKKDEILKNSYSTTLVGRKRHFDFLSASDFMRSNYLREGVNTIFQGSAADLIKLSMNKIHGMIIESKIHDIAKMLLQVHDELIFEIKEDCVKDIANEIKKIMEGIYTLKVPLVCNLSIGKTWAELK